MSQAQPVTPALNPAEAYEQYFVPAMFEPGAHALLERAVPQPGERVLDVACGTGIVARNVAPIVGPTGSVVGIDINPAMLAVARSTDTVGGAPMQWHEGSAQALPFPAGAFDLVLCQQGLQFFPDRAAALREMRRVVGEGGRVALSVNQRLVDNPIHEALYQLVARHLATTADAIAQPFALGDAGELHALLTTAGWERVDVQQATVRARFPQPARFVQLTILSSAAVLPVFAQMEPAARQSMIERVAHELEPTLRTVIEGNAVTFDIAINVALATA